MKVSLPDFVKSSKTLRIENEDGHCIHASASLYISIDDPSELFPKKIKISVEDLIDLIPSGEDKDQQALDQFEIFWEKYKKKVGKDKSEKIWLKLKPKEREHILDVVDAFVAAHPDIQYRPNPQTFLNNRRWEDDLPNRKKQTTESWAKPNTWND